MYTSRGNVKDGAHLDYFRQFFSSLLGPNNLPQSFLCTLGLFGRTWLVLHLHMNYYFNFVRHKLK